LVFVTELWLTN